MSLVIPLLLVVILNSSVFNMIVKKVKSLNRRDAEAQSFIFINSAAGAIDKCQVFLCASASLRFNILVLGF